MPTCVDMRASRRKQGRWRSIQIPLCASNRSRRSFYFCRPPRYQTWSNEPRATPAGRHPDVVLRERHVHCPGSPTSSRTLRYPAFPLIFYHRARNRAIYPDYTTDHPNAFLLYLTTRSHPQRYDIMPSPSLKTSSPTLLALHQSANVYAYPTLMAFS